MRPWLFIDGFMGGGAITLAVLGGLSLSPPCGYTGGKRRHARCILGCLGVTPGAGADLLLAADAPPGVMASVWPALLHPDTARQVASSLRNLGRCECTDGGSVPSGACSECRGSGRVDPVKLWHALAAVPPHEDLIEGAARGLWLQGRACSNLPLWWEPSEEAWVADGMSLEDNGRRYGKRTRHAQDQSARSGRGKMPTHGAKDAGDAATRTVEGAGRYVVDSNARGARKRGEVVTRTATTKEPGRYVYSDHAPGSRQLAGMSHAPRPGGESKEAVQRGQQVGTTSAGLMSPDTLARRCDALADAVARVLTLQAGGARSLPIAVHQDGWSLHGYAHLSLSARERGFQNRGSATEVAARVDRIADCVRAGTFGGLMFHAGDFAATIPPGDLTGGVVYLDPPCLGRTAYPAQASRERVVEVALDAAARGARVGVSEGTPIPELRAAGWHGIEITRRIDRGAPQSFRAGKEEWLMLSHPPVTLLPEVPEQRRLFPGGEA